MCTQKTKARKYQLTFNNPVDHGFTHEVIRTTLASFPGIQYWCMCDEVGEQGTPHTHLYLYSPNAILFTTLQNRFMGAHIEMAKGIISARRVDGWMTASMKPTFRKPSRKAATFLRNVINGSLSALKSWK